jgi:hypothetical protein
VKKLKYAPSPYPLPRRGEGNDIEFKKFPPPWRGEGRVGVMEVESFMQGLDYETLVKGYCP